MAHVTKQDELEQRSIKQPIGCVGSGLLTGERVALTLSPAKSGHGIQFRRTDQNISTTLRLDDVFLERESLCLSGQAGQGYFALDGLLIALAHCGITNVLVELNGPEAPFLDGSAQAYVFLIQCAGIEDQKNCTVRETGQFAPKGRGRTCEEVTIEPCEQLVVQFGRSGQMIMSSEEVQIHMIDARRGVSTLDLVNIDACVIALRGRTPLLIDHHGGVTGQIGGARLEAQFFEEARIWACLRLLGSGLRAKITMRELSLDSVLSAMQSMVGNSVPETNQAVRSHV